MEIIISGERLYATASTVPVGLERVSLKFFYFKFRCINDSKGSR